MTMSKSLNKFIFHIFFSKLLNHYLNIYCNLEFFFFFVLIKAFKIWIYCDFIISLFVSFFKLGYYLILMLFDLIWFYVLFILFFFLYLNSPTSLPSSFSSILPFLTSSNVLSSHSCFFSSLWSISLNAYWFFYRFIQFVFFLKMVFCIQRKENSFLFLG